ncbi:MAG: sensor domain-containing diguanylate cyclase [Rhodocyclaceae bacterium]|nr:sensor domain-containing diguanylate cyclase [Rhodocyclaceae bacterium]
MQNGLQFENYSLRQQLEALLNEARRNEDKMRRFDQLERSLIGARSLTELLRVLLVDYKAAFDIEFVSLALLDEEYEAARILEASTGGALLPGLLLLQSDELLEPVYATEHATEHTTCLCAFDARRHGPLFDAPAGAIASVALLPLVRQGKLMGSLQLGSVASERYDAAAGTDFLDRLAAIVAFCLESALTQERLKRVGLTDSLTGVQNRRYFEHRCLVEISQAQRHRQPLACMFLDIDKFKRINDSHGHQSGDVVLRGVADVIQAQLRTSDTIARYGGEEFVVLLPQTAALHAQEIAERIRVAVAAQLFRSQSDQTVPVTISIGLAMLPLDAAASEPAVQAEMLVAAADRALYQAKHGGRNRVVSDFVCPARSERETWQGRVAQWLSSVQRQFRGALAHTAR